MPELESAQDNIVRFGKWKALYQKKFGKPLRARWKAFSRCWALGTESKPYSSCEVKKITTNHDSGPRMFIPSPGDPMIEDLDLSHVPDVDLRRLPPGDPRRLALANFPEGEMFMQARGKEVVVASGTVAIRFNMGLEAHFVRMEKKDLDEITSKDRPGSSSNPERAELMRSFELGPRFIDPGSNVSSAYLRGRVHGVVHRDDEVVENLGDDLLVSNLDDSQEILENAGSDSEEGGDCDQNIAEDLLDVAAGSPEKSYLEALRADILEAEAASPGSTRAVNLLGAFFGEDKALGIFDFARLVRMTIHILDRSWTEDDLLLTSELCSLLWGDNTGADYGTEEELALANLDRFRHQVIRAYQDHKAKIKPKYTGTDFQRPFGEVLATRMDIFNGLGQKQSSDLQDYLEIHPNTKTGVALSDDDLYLRLREYLPRYARLQHTPEYVKTVGTLSTHPNPFSFHYSADKRYISQYVRVFRLGRVKVDRARWIRMQNKGLFDYGHIIGDPFPLEKQVKDSDLPASMKYRFVNVHQLRRLVVVKTGKGETARETRKAVVHGYTIICASLRKAHKANLKVKAYLCNKGWRDARAQGQKSVIGHTSYHELTANRTDLRSSQTHAGGRIARLKNGQRGRPSKSRKSKAELEKAEQVMRNTRFEGQLKRAQAAKDEGEKALADKAAAILAKGQITSYFAPTDLFEPEISYPGTTRQTREAKRKRVETETENQELVISDESSEEKPRKKAKKAATTVALCESNVVSDVVSSEVYGKSGPEKGATATVDPRERSKEQATQDASVKSKKSTKVAKKKTAKQLFDDLWKRKTVPSVSGTGTRSSSRSWYLTKHAPPGFEKAWEGA